MHQITTLASKCFCKVRQYSRGAADISRDVNPPSQATMAFSGEVERKFTPVPHCCLKRHEQRDVNIRMQLFERDLDRKGACLSCLAVKENVVSGQRSEQHCSPVRDLKCFSVSNKAHRGHFNWNRESDRGLLIQKKLVSRCRVDLFDFSKTT